MVSLWGEGSSLGTELSLRVGVQEGIQVFQKGELLFPLPVEMEKKTFG